MNRAIVITGSRDYPRRWGPVHELLAASPGSLIIHGDCPTGVDAIAAVRAGSFGHGVLSMPAQWDEYGRSAGPRRNRQMAKVAATLRDCGYLVECHAFPLGASRGTRDCVKALKAVGLDVQVHDARDW